LGVIVAIIAECLASIITNRDFAAATTVRDFIASQLYVIESKNSGFVVIRYLLIHEHIIVTSMDHQS